MDAHTHRYSARPTRNPLRYGLAVWRLIRRSPEETTAEAAIVEIGFARSRLGRRFARWEEAIAHLKADPRTAASLEARKTFGPIELERLDDLPAQTLGRVFADHCRARSIDPNLVHVPPEGEVGLGGFYAAQFGSPPFFGYLMAIILLNTIYRRGSVAEVFEAFTAGYQAGRRTRPLFGVDWEALWSVPIEEVRERFEIDLSTVVGEGIREAA
jgi:ubiquinone biosynthesis protein Coq4